MKGIQRKSTETAQIPFSHHVDQLDGPEQGAVEPKAGNGSTKRSPDNIA